MTNPVPKFSTQRGLPYDPALASGLREKVAKVQAEQEARETRRQRTLAHARRLDQIEHAWRERARDRRRVS